jgi:hypothetical protein
LAAATAVKESVVTVLLVALFPAAHGATGDAEKLGNLPPLKLSAHCFEDQLLAVYGLLVGGASGGRPSDLRGLRRYF